MSRQIRIASMIWGVSILLSRVVGLVREAVIGRVMGGGSDADVFWTSFLIPDFLNYLLAAGALSIVFIPIFAGHISRGEPDRGWTAFSVIANFIVALLLVVTPLLWLAVPSLAPLIAPGFDDVQLGRMVTLTRIMLPAQIFHIVGGLLSAALLARDKHTLPALAPLFYTGSIIVGGLVGGTADGFAWGVLVGSIIGPFGLPLIGNLRAGLRWRPQFSWTHPDLRAYLWRSLPIMVGFSIVMADDWLLRNQASLLEEGAISTLQYAKTLMKVPMGVFGLATGVAAFPTLSRLVGSGDHAAAYKTLSSATRTMLVMAFGAQVALTCAGAEIAAVIYGDRLPAEQHAAIGAALSIFGIGLWAWAAQTVISRGFYALGQTWLPTLIGSAVVLLCAPLYVLLRVEVGVLGLPIATSIAMTTYVVALILMLRRRFPGQPDGYGAFFTRIVPAVVVGIGVGAALEQVVHIPWPLLQGAVLGGAGLVAYVLTATALQVPEVRRVGAMVARRVRR